MVPGSPMRHARTTVVLLSRMLVTPSAVGAQALRPLVIDWEQYFRVESRPVSREGRSMATGIVWNTATWNAKRIQLLVEAVDGNGQAVKQQVIWLGVDLAAGTHASFEGPMPASASYRVSIFAFDSGRGGRWSYFRSPGYASRTVAASWRRAGARG